MPLRATLLLLFAAACRREGAAPAAPLPQSCLDRQLAAKGLNQFGDPVDTAYPGGTPLFDEASGKSTDRAAYIFAKHPDIARACANHD